MLKIVTGVFVTAVVGTLAYEVIKRRRPELLLGVTEQTRRAARNFVEGFREGYRGTGNESA